MKNCNIFLGKFYNCTVVGDPPVKKTMRSINCKHWSTDDNCITKCSLNVINNPEPHDCAKCSQRECIVENPPIPKPKIVATITDDSIKNGDLPEPSFFKKAISYAKAETSQFLGGKVSEEVFEKRKNICMECNYRINPKPESELIGWCKGGCGCSIGAPRSALSQKLYMPSLKCPQQKFDVEKGEGFNVGDAMDSLRGAAEAINSTIKEEKQE